MAKRRSDDLVLLRFPSKRLCRSLRLVDVQRGSASPTGGVHPPSLLALAAGGSRKRSFYTEDPDERTPKEASPGRKMTRTSPVVMERTSGCSSGRVLLGAAPTCSETWPPEDCTRLDTKGPRIRDKADDHSQPEDCTRLDTKGPRIRDKADDHSQPEDCRYNSFQFWRSPLPALDLSLLEDTSRFPEEDKSKVPDCCHAMETG